MPKKISKTKAELSHKVFLSKDYYSDIVKPEMLHAILIRCPQPGIKITNIDLSFLPSDYYFFTSRDIPGKNLIRTLDVTTTIFAEDFIRYKGEPVGILCGENKDKLKSLAAELSSSFTELKQNAQTDSEKTEKILARRTVKTGVFETIKELDSIEFSEQFLSDNKELNPEDNIRVYSEWKQEDFFPDWNENTGAFCYMDGKQLTVLSPTKWPSHLKQSICEALGIEDEKIILKKTQIQKTNFNGTWRTTAAAVQTAIASFITGKPVKLIFSKQEQKDYMDSKINLKIRHLSSVNKENIITAMAIDIDSDAGYCNPYAQEFIDRVILSSVSVYNPQSLYIRAQIRSSDNPPTSIYPEVIDSSGYCAVETHLQKIADAADCLPDELRQKNICTGKNILHSPFNYKLTDPLKILDPIITQSSFKRKYSAYNLDSRYLILNQDDAFFSLTRRGIGFSFAIDGSGYYGSSIYSQTQNMEATLEKDGTLSIHSPVPGAAVIEIWKNLCAEMLELKQDSVKILTELPDDQIPDLPENVYNNVSIMTVLLKKCCQEIQKKRFLNPLPIHASKSITSSMKKNWKKDSFSGMPFHTVSYGGAIIEIENNPLTMGISVKGIWIVIDCGQIMSIKAAEKAVKIAIQNELKNLITDEELYCSNVKINFIQSGNNPGQIGEIIHSLIPSAFANALSQILCTNINEIPCSLNQIYTLSINSKKALEEKLKKQAQEEQKTEENQQLTEIEQSIQDIQKPLQEIISEMEENRQEQKLLKQEEFNEKAEEISKADDEAIKILLEQEALKQKQEEKPEEDKEQEQDK